MMGFDWTDVKAQVRGIVDQTFRVAATYQDQTLSVPVPVTVRWHNKIARQGDLEGAGYAEIIEGVERLIFNRDLLLTANAGGPLRLVHKGVVTLTDPRYNNAQFWLEAREPIVGPVEEIWNVSRV